MRGINSITDNEESNYKSFGGFNFSSKEKAKSYNKRIPYKFENESSRILAEMKKGKAND